MTTDKSKLGLVRRGRAAHNGHDIAICGTVMGICNSRRCVGNHRWADVKGFYDGRVLFRCRFCNGESWLNVGDPDLTAESLFFPDEPGLRKPMRPWTNDEDAEKPTRDYTDFNRRSGRAHRRMD